VPLASWDVVLFLTRMEEGSGGKLGNPLGRGLGRGCSGFGGGWGKKVRRGRLAKTWGVRLFTGVRERGGGVGVGDGICDCRGQSGGEREVGKWRVPLNGGGECESSFLL